MFVDILAIILIVLLSFIFCINDNNYKCQLSHIIIGLTVIVFYKLYKCIMLKNSSTNANINMLNNATMTNNKNNLSFNHPQVFENFVSSTANINEFIANSLSSSVALPNDKVQSLTSTQLNEYTKKIDALINSINELKNRQDSSQNNDNVSSISPDTIQKLDLESQQQYQMFQIDYLNKQLQNAKDIINARTISSTSSNYKPIKVYSSCVISNADGTTSIDTPVKAPFTNQPNTQGQGQGQGQNGTQYQEQTQTLNTSQQPISNMLQTITQTPYNQKTQQQPALNLSQSSGAFKPVLDALFNNNTNVQL